MSKAPDFARSDRDSSKRSETVAPRPTVFLPALGNLDTRACVHKRNRQDGGIGEDGLGLR
jgi:hypothetical protein